MNRKMAIGVVAGAVGLVGVAFVLSSRRDMTPERERGSALLPGLEAKAPEIGAVEVLRVRLCLTYSMTEFAHQLREEATDPTAAGKAFVDFVHGLLT